MQAASVYLRTPREWNYWLCHIDCVADLARHATLSRYDVFPACCPGCTLQWAEITLLCM